MMNVFLCQMLLVTHLMAKKEYGTAATILIKLRVLGTRQDEYWVVPSNWETSCKKPGDRMCFVADICIRRRMLSNNRLANTMSGVS